MSNMISKKKIMIQKLALTCSFHNFASYKSKYNAVVLYKWVGFLTSVASCASFASAVATFSLLLLIEH